MERKCRHVRRVKQYRYKREYRRRGGKVINVERRKISRAVISRLPRYYRYLGDLLEIGVERISSNDLSKKMNVTASQIRQDLNNFGGFGQQGYGYNVKYLYTEIGIVMETFGMERVGSITGTLFFMEVIVLDEGFYPILLHEPVIFFRTVTGVCHTDIR